MLDGGFKYVLFSSQFGEDFQFDSYFSDGLKPPTRNEMKWNEMAMPINLGRFFVGPGVDGM